MKKGTEKRRRGKKGLPLVNILEEEGQSLWDTMSVVDRSRQYDLLYRRVNKMIKNIESKPLPEMHEHYVQLKAAAERDLKAGRGDTSKYLLKSGDYGFRKRIAPKAYEKEQDLMLQDYTRMYKFYAKEMEFDANEERMAESLAHVGVDYYEIIDKYEGNMEEVAKSGEIQMGFEDLKSYWKLYNEGLKAGLFDDFAGMSGVVQEVLRNIFLNKDYNYQNLTEAGAFSTVHWAKRKEKQVNELAKTEWTGKPIGDFRNKKFIEEFEQKQIKNLSDVLLYELYKKKRELSLLGTTTKGQKAKPYTPKNKDYKMKPIVK